MNIALWIVQGLLAVLFIFAGGMKLVVPIETLTQQTPLPGLFVRFIGVAELLGGLGLVLPWLLRIRPFLTPLAAAGLFIIMLGAVGISLSNGDFKSASIPLVIVLLLAFVAYGRLRLSPLRAAAGSQSADPGQRPLSTGA